MPAPGPSLPLSRRLAYSGVLALVAVALAEGFGQALMYFYYGPPIPEHERLHEYDAELGWRNRPSRRVLDRYGPGRHATHNAQGLRAAADYSPHVPYGKYRIICLGDSFIYGIVGDEDTIPRYLERLVPRIEAVNMGGAGYGLDQAYLWYRRDGGRMDAQLLLFAVIEDDFRRMGMNAFMTGNPKPQLVLSGGELVTTNVPVPTWGAASGRHWAREFPNRMALVQLLRKVSNTYLERHDTFAVAERVLDDLGRLARGRGQALAMAYLPTKSELDLAIRAPEAAWLEASTRQRGIPFVDLTRSLARLSPAERPRHFHSHDQHYSAEGNRRTASLLLDALRRHFSDLPSRAE